MDSSISKLPSLSSFIALTEVFTASKYSFAPGVNTRWEFIDKRYGRYTVKWDMKWTGMFSLDEALVWFIKTYEHWKNINNKLTITNSTQLAYWDKLSNYWYFYIGTETNTWLLNRLQDVKAPILTQLEWIERFLPMKWTNNSWWIKKKISSYEDISELWNELVQYKQDILQETVLKEFDKLAWLDNSKQIDWILSWMDEVEQTKIWVLDSVVNKMVEWITKNNSEYMYVYYYDNWLKKLTNTEYIKRCVGILKDTGIEHPLNEA